MFMKLKDGKSKVLTLSYDDGVVQDIRLMEILDKYGIKATFNINTGMYLPEDTVRERFHGRMKLSEAQKLYTNSGHEVAVHCLTHPFLQKLKSDELLTEILEDRKNIEQQYGTLARGMAYPYGTYNQKVMDAAAACGICYSRTAKTTGNVRFPENWLEWDSTCHHDDPNFMALAKRFVEEPIHYESDAWLFYVYGHSYEFDLKNNWNVIEEFAQYVGGREDIWYATNIEIYDYVRAYERLQVSVERNIVHNPSNIDVWFSHKKTIYCVKAGQTLHL
jgi:peptidoglycan/xylan/chitin deacetylase (PgdA/CDA1 family)